MPITLNGDGTITGLTATGISAVQNLPNPAVITTLNTPTGVLATQNGMTGIAKAWVIFTGQGTATVRNSFNVSSVTRTGTGSFLITFTTAMPSVYYATNVTNGFNGSGNDWCSWYVGEMTTTTVRCQFANPPITASLDPSYVALSVNSN